MSKTLTPELKKLIEKHVEKTLDRRIKEIIEQAGGVQNLVVNDNVGRPTDRRGKVIKGEGIKASPVFGYDIRMFGNDHTPTHVHVYNNQNRFLGKIILYPTVYVEDTKENPTRIPEGDHAKLVEHFKINKKYYQEQWNAINEKGKPPKMSEDNHEIQSKKTARTQKQSQKKR